MIDSFSYILRFYPFTGNVTWYRALTLVTLCILVITDVNAIAASSRNDRIIPRAFLILHEQPNQQCKIDLSTTTKIPEFFYLYDRGM